MSLRGQAVLQMTEPDYRRFWSYVKPEPGLGSCWPWTGSTSLGYGTFGLYARPARLTLAAHRIAYQQHVGPIAEGHEIDHLCSNKACVNPAHLEAVSHMENVHRAMRYKTHCPKGHEFTPENTRMARRNGRARRLCRTCLRDDRRDYKARKREAERQGTICPTCRSGRLFVVCGNASCDHNEPLTRRAE